MRKTLSLLGTISMVAAVSGSVVSCNNHENEKPAVNDMLVKELHDRIRAIFLKEYSSKKYRLNKLYNTIDKKNDDTFSYLSNFSKKMARNNINNINSESGIDVSSNINSNTIMGDLTDNGIIFNERTLKSEINELVTTLEFGSLNTNGGNIYSGLSISNNSAILKFKLADNVNEMRMFNYISLSFNVELSWYYNSGGLKSDSTSIPILFQLIDNQVVIDIINDLSDNMGQQMYQDGSTRFVSEEPTKNVSKFNVLYSFSNNVDRSPTEILKKVYTRKNFKNAIAAHIKQSATFSDKIVNAANEVVKKENLLKVKIDTKKAKFDFKDGLLVDSEFNISQIGSIKDYKRVGIEYYKPFWGLFSGYENININDSYNTINDVILDYNQTCSNGMQYKFGLNKWLNEKVKTGVDKDVSQDSAIAYGSLIFTGMTAEIQGTNYDLGTVFIDYNYSNTAETWLDKNGQQVGGRNFYYIKLIYKHIQEFRKVLGVTGLKKSYFWYSDAILDISQDSDSVKSKINSKTNYQNMCNLISDKDANKMAYDLGMEKGTVKDEMNSILLPLKINITYKEKYISIYKSINSLFPFTWYITFGNIRYAIKFDVFFSGKYNNIKFISLN